MIRVTILQMNIYGSLLIIFTVIIRAVAINKLPKKMFIALWLIIISRLLIPYAMPQVINVYPMVNTIYGLSGEKSDIQNISEINVPQLNKYTTADESSNNITDITPAEDNTNNQNNMPNGAFIFTVIWLAGTFTLGALFIIPHVMHSQKYRAALPIEDENSYINSWVDSHRLLRKYKVMVSDEIISPFTYGLFRPVILLSANIDINNREIIDYILTHEYTHIKRFDIVLKWLSAVALCVNWFNPLVWVMYILMSRDIELSCDESVVRLKGETNRKSYAITLLDMESAKTSFNPLVNHFNKNSLKERVTAIMKIKKITILSIILAFVLIVSSTMILISSCTNTKAESPTAEEESTATTTEEATIIPETTEYTDPYANVRFGEDRDTLLLDIEWYTYDTWLAEVEKIKTKAYQLDDSYINASYEEKKQVDTTCEDEAFLKQMEEFLNPIKDGKLYVSRLINGKPRLFTFRYDVSDFSEISHYFDSVDSDGYYIVNVYPFYPHVSYKDENGIYQYKNFGDIFSKREYDYVLQNNIIPFCDDLLAKGQISQEWYDLYTADSPLDYYVGLYFS